MLNNELDRALGPTPQTFSDHVNRTLLTLKEEPPVKKLALRTLLGYALIAVLLGGTACALVSGGLENYYTHRFNAYQLHDPDKHSAILSHLQTNVLQSLAQDPAVCIAVTETSLALDEKLLVVSVLASAVDSENTELHPFWNLDADGAYMGQDAIIEPGGEERSEHWLWTQAGHGPVNEMVSPGKALLLWDAHGIYFDDSEVAGNGSSVDSYVTEDGAVHTVMELRLDFLDPDYETTIQKRIAADPANAAFWENHLEDMQTLRTQLEKGETVSLALAYTVTPYTEDDALLDQGGRHERLLFEIKNN